MPDQPVTLPVSRHSSATVNLVCYLTIILHHSNATYLCRWIPVPIRPAHPFVGRMMRTMQKPLQPIKANDISVSSHLVSGTMPSATYKPDRPCDACRRRKSRCVIDPAQSAPGHPCCTMCAYQKQPCTFKEGTIPRKRKNPPTITQSEDVDRAKRRYVLAASMLT